MIDAKGDVMVTSFYVSSVKQFGIKPAAGASMRLEKLRKLSPSAARRGKSAACAG